MIETLISSRTRILLLLRFFLNPENQAHLRGLATEFGESTNSIRLELNRFEDAGMLTSEQKGNRKMFSANTHHPLFPDIRNLVMKQVGLDHIIESILSKLGNPEKVYLTGDMASGRDTGIIDLVFVGSIDQPYLLSLIQKTESLIHRRIRFLVYDEISSLPPNFSDTPSMLLWNRNHKP